MSRTRRAHTAFALVTAILWSSVCPAVEADLQKDIERILDEEGLTGMAWTLISGTGEVSIGAAGLQDKHAGVAFNTDTRFHVGSLTKSLVATGVLRLATEGRIDLDAPALRYIPELSFDNPWAGISDVTVRHLLDHTSGLSDAQLWHIFSERSDPDAPLVVAFPDPNLQLRIRSQPGSRFSYSNMGYTLLGLIVESIVGDRYEDYLDERLLIPLRMRDSTFTFTTQKGENADPKLAWGHVDGGVRFAASPTFLRPAGQFTTTAADLARFADFLLSDGKVDGRAFIDEALMRLRGEPSGTESANEGLTAGYALGLGRRDRHGVVGYCHGGNIVGFVAMLCVFPQERKAFAYSVNTDSETANYGRLDSLFVSTLNIAEAPPPRGVTPTSDMAQWHGLYVLNPNRFQTFEYLDTVFGAIRISANGDSLTLASLQKDARQLRPVGDRLYSASDRQTTSHVLYRDEDGKHLISDGFLTFEKVPSVYLAAHWISILLGLIGLTWILIAGIISFIRYRGDFFRRPEAPAFVASVLLFAPIPFFVAQSFMALGDLTLASASLAAVTALLPIGMLLTILLTRKKWRMVRIGLIHGLAAAFVLQWCAVLITSGMLPFRLWI